MVAWDVIESDLGGDETGNFGPRLEAGSALYQVNTVASIAPRGKVICNPRVFACARGDTVCVSAGSQLSVFEDGCRTFITTLHFDSDVEHCAWSPDGYFLVVGENNGTIHFFARKALQRLFSECILGEEAKAQNNEMTFKQMEFATENKDGLSDLIVLASTQKIFRFPHFDTAGLYEALENMGLAAVQDIQARMQIEVVDVSDVHTENVSYAVFLPSTPDTMSILTAGKGDDILCVWENEDGDFVPTTTIGSILQNDAGVKKCRLTQCGRFLIVLDENDMLSIWTVPALTIIGQVWDREINDFLLLESGDDNKVAEIMDSFLKMVCEKTQEVSSMLLVMGFRLVTLSVPTKGTSCVSILALPSYETVYSLELTAFTFLAQSPTFQETIFIGEGRFDEKQSDNGTLISNIHIKCLTEALPETRLFRLLHKKMFDDAEIFAQQFGLDVELVYKVKSSHLLDLLSPWNEDQLEQGTAHDYFSQLKSCFELIKDDSHVIDLCISASLTTFGATLEILTYARNRLQQHMSQQNGHPKETVCTSTLMSRILERLHRLGTYQVAFGTEEYSGDHWDQFGRASMLDEFLQSLRVGGLHTAFSIWGRHHNEFDHIFKQQTLEDILLSIPENAMSQDLKPWLADDFIPYLIKIFPEGLILMASWLEQRSRNMELLEKEGWPKNGLEMCEVLQKTYLAVSQTASERGLATPEEFSRQVCNLSVGHAQIQHMQECGSSDDAFVRLHTLITQLKDLLSLHVKYKCRLSLAEYSQETTESLTYRMLDRVVAAELIQGTIDNIVRPYMKEHNLNEDRMLFQYIGDLTANWGRQGSCLGEAPWEAKAIAVVCCIQDPDYKCRAILDAMRRAYIPWSSDMEELVQVGLALDHPRVAELKEQCCLMNLRKMLTNYNMRNYNVTDDKGAETLIYYILSQDQETALEDALEVVKTYDHLDEVMAYVFRMRFLISHKRLEECVELLKSLPPPIALKCGSRLVINTCIILDDDIVIDEQQSKQTKMAFTKAACEILKVLLSNELGAVQEREFGSMLQDLQNIQSLQVEYGEFIGHRDYCDEGYRKQVLAKHLAQFFTQKDGMQMKKIPKGVLRERKLSRSSRPSYTKIYRLSHLLLITKDKLCGQLAIKAAERGQVDTALQICRDMYENVPTSDTAIVLYEVVHTLCRLQAEELHLDKLRAIKNLPQIMHEMANQAVNICSPDMLVDCLELSCCTGMASSVSRQCESGDYGMSVQTRGSMGAVSLEKDLQQEWLAGNFFDEDGLVMDSATISPIVYRYTMACLPTADPNPQPYCYNRLESTPMSVEPEAVKEEVEEGDESRKEESKQAVSPLQPLSMCALQARQYFQENNQTELALKYLVQTIGTALQYFTIQNMGFPANTKEFKEAKQREKEMLTKMIQMGATTVESTTDTLLQKIFNQSNVDHELALGHFCSLPKQKALDRLQKLCSSSGVHYKKAKAIAQVGINYSTLCNEPKCLLGCQEMLTSATWGHRLAKLKISFKDAYTGGTEAKRKLLVTLVQHEAVDTDFIKDYCRDFKLDEEEAVYMYLERLLLPSSGGGEVEETEAQAVRAMVRARKVIEDINDANWLLTKLTFISNQLDPYDYERLYYVLTEVYRLRGSPQTETALKLLVYLKNYTRVAPPSQYEIDYKPVSEENQLMYGNRVLSPKSKTRLPFHPLLMGEPWKIISPELNATTVVAWLQIANLLKLSPDQVYLTAIQNIVKKHCQDSIKAWGAQGAAGPDKSKCNWNCSDGVDMQFFETLRKLLMQVTNCEMGVACGSWVVKELPMGAEKLLALKALVNLAQNWLQACPDESEEKKKAKEAYVRFSDILRRLSTEQVLFQANIGEQELISNSNRPAKLIFKLYEHSSILHRSAAGSIVENLPDIHKVADDIAGINSTNISKIRLTLVEQWLVSSQQSKQEDADTTMTFNINVNCDTTLRTDDEINEDEINLKRVTYLLQNGSLESNAMFLLNFAFKTDATKITNMCRVRALRCLFALVDKKTIEKLCSKPVEDIRYFMQTLLYLEELERLHVPQTLESFHKCKKEGLVRGIWRNHSHEKRAVRLVADLCLDYKIFDVQLWNSVLQQLLAFGMVDYLRHVLICIAGQPQLLQVSCMPRIWRSVLVAPLSTVVPPLTEEQQMECNQSALTLQRCPLLVDMDVGSLSKQFSRLELYVCALGCLLLVPQEDHRNTMLQALLEGDKRTELVNQLNLWYEAGWTIPLFKQVQSMIRQPTALERDHNESLQDKKTEGSTVVTTYSYDDEESYSYV